MLKIYHAPRARSLRVIWLCEEMGVPYEVAPASFMKPTEEFKSANSLLTIPALADGDVTMIESIAMMIYIMAKYGPTDLQVEPGEANYADYLQYLVFGEASMAAYGNPLVGTRYRAPEDQKQNWTAGYIRDALARRMQFAADGLSSRDFIVANRFTAADISIAYVVNLSKFAGIEDIVPASLHAYFERLRQRPAYQRAAAVE